MYLTFSNRINAKLVLGFILSVLIISLSLTLIYRTVNATNVQSTDLERTSGPYWSRADNIQTGLDLSGNFTLEAWVKLESTGVQQEVIGKTHTTGYQGYIMRILDTNKVRCYTLGNDPDLGYVDGSTTLTTGTWYHLACVYDGSTIKAYVDGSQDGNANTTVNPTDNSQEFRIGERSATTGASLDGLIDEVRVWSIARTQTQLQDNMNRELTGAENGLVGYWQFEGTGNDSSSNGNTLSNNNSATFINDKAASFVGNVLAVRKDTYQTSTTTTLVNVDDLTLNLEANTNYTIEGALFAIASSTTPDLSIAFEIPSGATMDIGYVGGYDAAARDADVLSASGVGSSRIELDATYPTIIQINGTIKMGSTDGNVILKWGQAQSNVSNILIKPGSYLRAQGI